MAFHQPTRQAAHRIVRVEPLEREPEPLAPQVSSGPEESQTWVLFSPATDVATTTSYLSSVVDSSQPTPGRSRLSELGSLDPVAPSDPGLELPPARWAPSPASGDPAGGVEDDAELDSLDSHLPAFRSHPTRNHELGEDIAHAVPVLPGHDGLGSFGLLPPLGAGGGSELQERLYAFEKYNPRRAKRRRESVDLAEMETDHEDAEATERNRRIEAWRLEQSQYLLERIRKETRRRRLSELSVARSRGPPEERNQHHHHQQQQHQHHREAFDHAVLPAGPDGQGPAAHVVAGDNDWHDQDAAELPPHAPCEPSDGLWTRITRRVIGDLMGIDDRLLSILFGEALPGDEEDDLASAPRARQTVPTATATTTTSTTTTTTTTPTPGCTSSPWESYDDSSSWQVRVLERVARELGLLIYRLSNHQPGAFSTYARVQQAPVPYAGLPVIPELAVPDSHEAAAAAAAAADAPEADSVLEMPPFRPTVPLATSAHVPAAGPAAAGETRAAEGTFTQQEWERDLDISLVFRYLRSRFASATSSSSSSSSSTAFGGASAGGPSHAATSSAQDAAARTAWIRQYHPLVSQHPHPHPHHHHHHHHQQRPAERRGFKAAAAAATPSSPLLLRHPGAGSCASQSTRRSAKRSSVSSRHYWDLGGSIGTGSVVTSSGPMGSWGEV